MKREATSVKAGRMLSRTGGIDSENALVGLILSNLDGILPDSRFVLEARSHGRARTDILLWNGLELTAVEAKTSDWQTAIAQAALNRYFADRSYIALWHTVVHSAVIEEAGRHGVGVLSVHDANLRVGGVAPRAFPSDALRLRVLNSHFGDNI
jgi:hypothetical protein